MGEPVTDQRTVIAFDPGGTTGWAMRYWRSDREHWQVGQIAGHRHHLDLWHLLERRKPGQVVCERFEYRQEQEERHKIELISRDYIGVITLWCLLNEVPLRMQSPMNVMGRGGFFGKENGGDLKMEKMGKKVPGGYKTRHARDGMRHLLHWEVFDNGRTELLLPLKES